MDEEPQRIPGRRQIHKTLMVHEGTYSNTIPGYSAIFVAIIVCSVILPLRVTDFCIPIYLH